MNKKAFLKVYQDVKQLSPEHKEVNSDAPNQPKLYRSIEDENLIKSYHYAKFQKNLHQAQSHPNMQSLIDKKDWDDEDTEKLLAMLR